MRSMHPMAPRSWSAMRYLPRFHVADVEPEPVAAGMDPDIGRNVLRSRPRDSDPVRRASVTHHGVGKKEAPTGSRTS